MDRGAHDAVPDMTSGYCVRNCSLISRKIPSVEEATLISCDASSVWARTCSKSFCSAR